MKIKFRTDSEVMDILAARSPLPEGSCCHRLHDHDDGTTCYVVAGPLAESLARDIPSVEVVTE